VEFIIGFKGQIGNPNRESPFALEKNQHKEREVTTEVTAGGTFNLH
jgi:hypothetical protein